MKNISDATSKLTLSWRIGLLQWESDEAFERLLILLKNHQSVVDEVALFETITHHLYIPLDEYARRMAIAERRIIALHQAGIPSVGINVLCTIGHINEAWSYMPALPFQPMVGHDGSVSTSCACPNTTKMRDYVKSKYGMVADTKPDFIWVDDDIRMHNHGVTWGCFCPGCMDIFNKTIGYNITRNELVNAFNDPDKGQLRELWVTQNNSTIESLLTDVKKAVHRVNPGIALGKMGCGPGWTTYSGQSFSNWYVALGATKSRPGGGFYNDATPIAMFEKTLECGRQIIPLPSKIKDLQYELENFPYQKLKKSATALINECSLALAYGLNGIAFNMLGMSPQFEDSLSWMAAIPSARSLWEKWVKHTAGMPVGGLWPAWSSELMARRTVKPGENWLGWPIQYNINSPTVLGEIGLPLAPGKSANGTVLSGRVAEAFSDDELKEILSGGVLMDTMALITITERGLGHLAGVKIAERLNNGLWERFTDDELNGTATGQIRDARIEFWGEATGMGDILEPIAENVRVLSTIEDYFCRPRGAGMTAYENELGGRVVVAGYAQWIFLHSIAKRLQLQNIADWISRNTMPVRIDETIPLLAVTRIAGKGRYGAVMLLNAGMDSIQQATVHLRFKSTKGKLLQIGGNEITADITPEKNGGVLSLQNIEPWGLRVILIEKD